MRKFIVAFYAVDRAFGGPEEGGWWYDTGELVRLHDLLRSEDAAIRAAARANRLLDLVQRGHARVDSVLYTGGRYRACVFEAHPPLHFPEEQPHYE